MSLRAFHFLFPVPLLAWGLMKIMKCWVTGFGPVQGTEKIFTLYILCCVPNAFQHTNEFYSILKTILR